MSRPTFALRAERISLHRGDRPVLSEVGLAIGPTTRMAVVGPNGVGKSSLLRTLAGRLEPDTGVVSRDPEDLRVGLLDQEIARSPVPVRDHLGQATGVAEAQARFDAATRAVAAGRAGADEVYDRAFRGWMETGAVDFDARLELVFDQLGLPRRIADQATSSLSGGEAARVGLAALLLSRFDVTLLDEPTNDLDGDGLAVLESWVEGLTGGLVVVSHDRRFLERWVTSVVEIHEQHHTAAQFGGGWASYLEERAATLARARADHQRYVTERDRLETAAQRQREWVDRGVSRARKKPADGDKFRRRWALDQTEQLAGRARASARAADRLEVVDKPWEGWDLRFTVATTERSGTVVAELEGVVVRRGDFVLGPVDERIDWGERVHLAGRNGTGKSTLIAALLGDLDPSEGRVRLGPSVIPGVLGQDRGDLGSGERSLLDAFPVRADLDQTESRSVLAKFGIDADAVTRPVGTLSPGERTRAQLALFQARGVNFLVLDEPSNHLDLAAIEQLEQALEAYDGTLLLVSHDRALLDALRITRTVALD
ncbi:MAG: ABC-F family ATP-binding cassette domain-containing protein [Actinomycetota bacterium]